MKILIVFLLCLTGCSCEITITSPKFKVGDCIKFSDLESWETPAIHLVRDIGKSNYLISRGKDDGKRRSFDSYGYNLSFKNSSYYIKTDCSANLVKK